MAWILTSVVQKIKQKTTNTREKCDIFFLSSYPLSFTSLFISMTGVQWSHMSFIYREQLNMQIAPAQSKKWLLRCPFSIKNIMLIAMIFQSRCTVRPRREIYPELCMEVSPVSYHFVICISSIRKLYATHRCGFSMRSQWSLSKCNNRNVIYKSTARA